MLNFAVAGGTSGHLMGSALATILLGPWAAVLVLDEPTSGLDPCARRALINLLNQLPLTMLVSTHDMHLVRELLPRTVIMDQGHIVADGPTENLMSDVALLNSHGLERASGF